MGVVTALVRSWNSMFLSLLLPRFHGDGNNLVVFRFKSEPGCVRNLVIL